MTNDELFAWVMHRFVDVFEHRAVLKGGMVLRLLDSPRATNDLDYVFAPYTSKKDIEPGVRDALSGLDGARIDVKLHSTMLRAEVRTATAAIQVEATVAHECPSQPMPTGGFAHAAGVPSRVVRVMRLDVGLAHKLAAWNERRLARDLYDAYFLFGRAGVSPDLPTLRARLDDVRSRLPALRRTERMSLADLAVALTAALSGLDDDVLNRELGALLPETELAGLAARVRANLQRLVEALQASTDD